jgi:hypothetical protein
MCPCHRGVSAMRCWQCTVRPSNARLGQIAVDQFEAARELYEAIMAARKPSATIC